MAKNIIDAIIAIIKNKDFSVQQNKSNSVAQKGKGLELYIKKAFANGFALSESKLQTRFSNVFSYQGGTNNPPDAMIRGGAAIEIKKIEGNSQIQLNSSFPKQVLLQHDKMITKECQTAEKWQEKQLIYAIGIVEKSMLKHLFMVYGEDYCAPESCYRNLIDAVKTAVEEAIKATGKQLTASNELARVNAVDPIERTYMRVRGMWGMENPWKAFNISLDGSKNFTLPVLINDNIWNNLSNKSKLLALSKSCSGLQISDMEIKDPDNPKINKTCKLISFEI